MGGASQEPNDTNENQKEPEVPHLTERVLLVGDSNAGILSGQLKTQLGDHYEVMYIPRYTSIHVRKWVEERETALKKDQIVLIMVGTNDVKHRVPLNETQQNIEATAEILDRKETQWHIVQMPPCYLTAEEDNDYCSEEILELNIKMEERFGKRTIRIRKELKGDRLAIKQDNLHITPQAATKIAQVCVENIKNKPQAENRKEEPQQQKKLERITKIVQNDGSGETGVHVEIEEGQTVTEVILTDQKRAAKIIGAAGSNIRRIKRTCGVSIDTKYQDETRAFVLKGPEDCVNRAREEITNIITSTLKADTERKQMQVLYDTWRLQVG